LCGTDASCFRPADLCIGLLLLLLLSSSCLSSADGLGPFVYIMSGAPQGQLGMSANFRLPAGVSCSGGCVLQWGESFAEVYVAHAL
jgi:hypothetical protein